MSNEICRSCGARIQWVKTATGKSMPVNAETAGEGERVYIHGKHVSHFSTCPAAAKHRKKK